MHRSEKTREPNHNNHNNHTTGQKGSSSTHKTGICDGGVGSTQFGIATKGLDFATEREEEKIQQTNKKNNKKQTINRSQALYFFWFFLCVCFLFFLPNAKTWVLHRMPEHGISTEVWENGPSTHRQATPFHSMLGEGLIVMQV